MEPEPTAFVWQREGYASVNANSKILESRCGALNDGCK